MPNQTPPDRIPLSMRLTPEETAVLWALKRHMETRCGKPVSQVQVVRAAIAALVEVEADNGFTP